MINKLSHIYEGWHNAYFKKDLHPDQQRVAQRRLESCSNCKYSQEYYVKKVIDTIIDKITGREKKIKERIHGGFKCEICTCPLSKKVYAFGDQCPLPKYNRVTYPQAKRWGKASFDNDGKLIGSDEVYTTDLNSNS